jgi:hypothetical protein
VACGGPPNSWWRAGPRTSPSGTVAVDLRWPVASPLQLHSQKLVERMTFWFFRGAVGACVKVIMVTADQS